MTLRLDLPPRGVLRPNNAHDPLAYYYHPLVGWLYRHRLEMGLSLLPDRGRRVLEVGVGSGVLIPTLTRRYEEYVGTDLELAPGLADVVAPSCRATFLATDLLREDALPAASFDAVVCFSVLEHIRDSETAACNLARALAPGGVLVAGYPLVNRLMTLAFGALGYHGIDHHHVAAAPQITAALARVLRPLRRAAMPPFAPVSSALYQCTSWTTPNTNGAS